MRLDKIGVSAALSALGDHLEQASRDVFEIVVCGGSALQVLGLVDRTTKDVDILALAQTRKDNVLGLLPAKPLPPMMIEAAHIVARDFGLSADWLNPGPTDLLSQGLPDGLIDRLHSRQFGRKLVVHFIDRFDQICLKTYAAINGGGMQPAGVETVR